MAAFRSRDKSDDDDGPSPPKRKRYSTRSVSTKIRSQSRYMLRSNTNSAELIDHTALEFYLRKQTPLMKLSDDCLLATFEYMDPNTLSNLAGVCNRLKELARYQFRIKHRCFDTASLIGNGLLNVAMMAKIFGHFGDLITSLHLSCFLFGNSNNQVTQTSYGLLKLVKRNCPNLTQLTLEDFIMSQGEVLKVRQLFQPIENLVLDNCTLNCNDLGELNHLKTLKIQGGWNLSSISSRHFSKLEQLEFIDMETFEDDSLIHLVQQNPGIKRLSIVNCENLSTIVFAAIGQLKCLEEFEFHQYYRLRSNKMFQLDLMQLASIKNLKVLKLNCTKMSVEKLLEAFVKNNIDIEHMELVNGLFDDTTYEHISKLKTIKTLRLNEMNGLNEHHVSDFVKELKLLDTLHINTQANINRFSLKAIVRDGTQLSCLKIDSPSIILDVDTYQNILLNIKKREQNIKLDLTIYGDGFQLLVPESISKGPNEKWISVRELNRAHNQIFVHSATSFLGDDDEFDDFDDDGIFGGIEAGELEEFSDSDPEND